VWCGREARRSNLDHRHIKAPVPHPLCDGSRMSSVLTVSDLGNTCPDDHYRRTVHTVTRNPVIERIVPTASPIDFATLADVCDVGDSMEERPLFPVTRSRFRGVTPPARVALLLLDESIRLCLENLLSCPRPASVRSASQRRRPFPRKRRPWTIFEGHSETAQTVHPSWENAGRGPLVL
jgi:hypothetical protein